MLTIEDFFIEPGRNLTPEDEDLKRFALSEKSPLVKRWDTSRGQQIKRQWRASGYQRSVLDSLVGRYHGHTDIRGINLKGEDLSRADLSKIDFFAANLEGANLTGANLEDTWLSGSNIRGANFEFARMDGVILDDADFDSKTRFVGVDLNKINFTLAALIQEHAVTQNRIKTLERRQPRLAYLLKVTSDYGRNFWRFVVWCFLIILFFGVLYWLVPGAIQTNGREVGLIDSLYFSFIAFTTLGLVDMTPASPTGRTLFAVEVLFGYFMLALLIAILSRRVFGA